MDWFYRDIWQGWLTAGLAAVIAVILLKIDVFKLLYSYSKNVVKYNFFNAFVLLEYFHVIFCFYIKYSWVVKNTQKDVRE